jgi:hypothetical protein
VLNLAFIVNPLKWAWDAATGHRKEKARRARFKGISLTLGTEKVYLAWDGPLDGLTLEPAPRRLTPGAYTQVVEALDEAGIHAEWDSVDARKGVLVYETDKGRHWRKRIHGDAGREQHYVLKAFV